MFDIITRSKYYWRAKYAFRRYGQALSYARNRLTGDQARSMMYAIEQSSGWHHLISLDTDYVMEEALERWLPHPDLEDLVAEACEYVADKHEDHSDTAYYAKGWALEKVEEYARDRDIALKLTEDHADLEATFATAENI